MTFIFLIFTFKSRGSFLRAGAKAPTLWLSGGNRRVMCNAGICRHYILSCMYRFSFFRILQLVCLHCSRCRFDVSASMTDLYSLVLFSFSSFPPFCFSTIFLFYYDSFLFSPPKAPVSFPHPRPSNGGLSNTPKSPLGARGDLAETSSEFW